MPLIEPGKKAPDFALPDQHGVERTLASLAGRCVVLYFYPKDDTSDCSTEACDFRDALPRFDDSGASVLGVSPDDQRSHAKFADKLGLTFPILSDVKNPQGTAPVCHAYGVWQEKSMYGKKYMGVVRTTYLIAQDGRVARRWDKVRVEGHAADVMQAVQSLSGGEAEAVVEPKPDSRKSGASASNRTKAPAKKTSRTRTGPTRSTSPGVTKTVSKSSKSKTTSKRSSRPRR